MLIHTILSALSPIGFGVIVGWFSGKFKLVKSEYTRAYADFIVKIALPFALFLAAAKSTPASLFNIKYVITLMSGLIGTYIIGYIIGRLFFKHDNKNAIIQALSVSFPDMGFCGPPILLATVGSAGLIAVVLGNLIYTVVIIPFALIMFGKNNNGNNSNNIYHSLIKSICQPLVILPVIGALIAISGIHLSDIFENSVDQLAKTTGGISVFFLSLLISTIKININFEVLINVFIKNIIQGLIILSVGFCLGLDGILLKSAFIIGMLPTATSVPALAMMQNSDSKTATETVLLSTLLSFISISVAIVIVQML